MTWRRGVAVLLATVLVPLGLLAAPVSAQDDSDGPFPVEQGDSGAVVQEVQNLLNEYIALNDLDVPLIREDSIFGPNTKVTVDLLEERETLTQDSSLTIGEIDALRRRVEQLTESVGASVVKEGDTGINVETWQLALNDWLRLTNSPTELILEDGIFGPNSDAVTREFERQSVLLADGIVDAADRAAMRDTLSDLRDGSDLPPLQFGDDGNVVENAQDLLNDWLALSQSTSELIREDGVFGPNTRAAALEFERAENLAADGVLTRAELVALRRRVTQLEDTLSERVVQLNDTGRSVESWESQLNDWIFLFDRDRDFVDEDDMFGVDTDGATKAFEASVGLQIDGIVEPVDRSSMRQTLQERRNRPGTLATAETLDDVVAASDYDAAVHGEILRLYPAFFNREADADGARYWIQTVFGRNQQSIEQVTSFFSSDQQPEFVNFYADIPATDNAAYLTRVYDNVLGRTPDTAGFNYWLNLMDTGELDRGGVVRWVALNPEFVARFPYGSN